MYGIGASLDVAGMRFAAVLVIISFLCANLDSANWQRRLGYVISFFIIVIIGNMIGRTTTVGAGMAILCWIYTLVFGDDKQKAEDTLRNMSLFRLKGIYIRLNKTMQLV